MSENHQHTIGQGIPIQNKNGWNLVTHYRTAGSWNYSLAYETALKKASSITCLVMIRSYKKNCFTYWEIWEHM